MKQTIIIYQYPLALPDVYHWAADQKVELQFEPEKGCYSVTKLHEEIILIPSDLLVEHSYHSILPRPDKVVLWGAFTREQLEEIIKIY